MLRLIYGFTAPTFRYTMHGINKSYIHIGKMSPSEHKMMRKMMSNDKKKKHKYNASTPLLPSATSLSKGSYDGKQSGNSRRANVLNKLFMRYITDLMATGECSSEIVGRGIEINRVQVTPDYKAVHVFWVSNSSGNDDDDIEGVLKRIASDLRCELANLNIVGLIPMIKFFKDKDHWRILSVDQRLAIADFGEDHEPVQYSNKLKTELKLSLELDETIKSTISNLESEFPETYEEPLPEMPQCVLGLDHASISDNVIKCMKKSDATNRLHPPDCNNLSAESTVNENPIRFPNVKVQNEAFRTFLNNRKILEARKKREDKNYRPEMDYLQEKPEDLFSFSEDKFIDDYIEEDK